MTEANSAKTTEATTAPAQETLMQKISDLLAKIPAEQKAAAADVLAQYGLPFFQMARDDALGYLRRIMAGDIQAVADLDSAMSTDEFIARVKTNTARWDNVAGQEILRDQTQKKILVGMAPVVVSILAAFLGL